MASGEETEDTSGGEGDAEGGKGEAEEETPRDEVEAISGGREEVEEGEASVEEIGCGTEDGENIPGEIEDWTTSEVNRGISSSTRTIHNINNNNNNNNHLYL